MRILIDQDSTIYDLTTPWYALHNEEYGHIHDLKASDVYTWNTQQICDDNNCPADVYSYFSKVRCWTDGLPIQNSVSITKQWSDKGHELGILTTTPNTIAPNYKLNWLKEYFPHIKHAMIVNGYIKHWVQADFLIDDGKHNLEQFEGIGVLIDNPWNQGLDVPRARDWNHVQMIVAEGIRLLENNTFLYMKENPHKIIERMLSTMIKDGIL